MLYFIDTKFIGLTKIDITQLISVGIVAEDGRQFYAESNEFLPSKANKWVKDNVFHSLIWDPYEVTGRHAVNTSDNNIVMLGSIEAIKKYLLEFIDSKPAFVGYCSVYDWIVFCRMFGRVADLPNFYTDLALIEDIIIGEILVSGKPLPDIKRPLQYKEHNALDDAKWNKEYYDMLIKIRSQYNSH